MPDTRRVLPARRIYYDWEDISTKPDARLSSAFDETNPGATRASFDDDDGPTWIDWGLPALVLLVGGFFLGKWWAGRKSSTSTTTVGEDEPHDGLNLLGATP